MRFKQIRCQVCETHKQSGRGLDCDCVYNQLKECAPEYRFKKLVRQQFFHFTRAPQTGDAGVMITFLFQRFSEVPDAARLKGKRGYRSDRQWEFFNSPH